MGYPADTIACSITSPGKERSVQSTIHRMSVTEAVDEARKIPAFRIGLMRRVGARVRYKPAALLGLAADGGVFITPYQDSSSWRYGVLEDGVPVDAASAESIVKPKVHYHRSGRVYATLTGHDLERRSLELPPLTSLERAQIFSLMSVRTWELPTRERGMERGDSATAVRRWPDVARWGVFLIEASDEDRQPLLLPELRGHGLLAGQDYTHGIVSLSAYDREAVLLVTVRTTDTWDDLPVVGGTTVAALRWHPGTPTASDRSFGLWTASLRNPLINWEQQVPENLTPTSTTSTKTLDEDIDRLADFAVPDGGLVLRPRIAPANDFLSTPFFYED